MTCPTCKNIRGGGVSGVNEARNLLGQLVTFIMLAGEAAAQGRVAHPWLQEIGVMTVPRQFAELTGGLAGRAPSVFGHDSMDGYEAQKKIIAAAGLPETWGLCQTCGGSAEVADVCDRCGAETRNERVQGRPLFCGDCQR